MLNLTKALELFEQTFGSCQSELELQATTGALATVIDLKNDNLNDLVHQITQYYQQAKSLNKTDDATDNQVSVATIQKAKERLADTEATLILLIRTYLQRVSSKLSATEFVELAKAAVALLDDDQLSLSFPESKRLLYIALQTFGTQLSQPIPALGERIPKRIAKLLARLTRYQTIIRTEGLEATLMSLVAQTMENTDQRLSRGMVRNALSNSAIAIPPELATQNGLKDLASVLFFNLQLQISSSSIKKSEREIAAQLSQAITEFKAKYRSLRDVTQPVWDDNLSVSSAFFNSNNFATASNDFVWVPPKIEGKSSKDETNA